MVAAELLLEAEIDKKVPDQTGVLLDKSWESEWDVMYPENS